MPNDRFNAAPPVQPPVPLPSGSAGAAPINAATSAVLWLRSIGEKAHAMAEAGRLEDRHDAARRSDALLCSLYGAHVVAFMDADVCGYCGEFSAELRRGRCPECREDWV